MEIKVTGKGTRGSTGKSGRVLRLFGPDLLWSVGDTVHLDPALREGGITLGTLKGSWEIIETNRATRTYRLRRLLADDSHARDDSGERRVENLASASEDTLLACRTSPPSPFVARLARAALEGRRARERAIARSIAKSLGNGTTGPAKREATYGPRFDRIDYPGRATPIPAAEPTPTPAAAPREGFRGMHPSTRAGGDEVIAPETRTPSFYDRFDTIVENLKEPS